MASTDSLDAANGRAQHLPSAASPVVASPKDVAAALRRAASATSLLNAQPDPQVVPSIRWVVGPILEINVENKMTNRLSNQMHDPNSRSVRHR